MAVDYFVLSNFGVRYYLMDFTDTETVPTSATPANEITSVISCNIGAFSKENTKYRTLNSNGWESIATLGNASEDGEFQCVREGSGDVYAGEAGTGTYTRVKDWFMKATAGAGAQSPKCIVEILPRGANQYEATCYYCVPNQWTPGTRDTETGQEYSFTVSPFGPPVPLTATYAAATDTFTLAKAADEEST